MRARPNFYTPSKSPGRVNLVNGIGFALWAFGPGTGTDAKIATQVGIGLPKRFQGSSPLVPNYFIASNEAGSVVGIAGTTELSQWLSYLTSFGVSPCNGVGGVVFTPFETWATEITLTLKSQLPTTGRVAICGHSLGGALAHVIAAKLVNAGYRQPAVYTSGCPRIGDEAFTLACTFDAHNVIRPADLVPNLPPSSLSNPIYFAGGVPFLPAMFRPGHDWHLPGSVPESANPAAWIRINGPGAWPSQITRDVRAAHGINDYLSQAWRLCDQVDKEAAAAWGIVGSNFWGLDLQPA